MSTSAAQASAFFREALAQGAVWSVTDDAGHPAPVNPDGQRSMPFWSKPSRAERIVDHVPAYAGFRVVRIGLDDWTSRWLPGLESDNILVGINWSGPRAQGYDMAPDDVLAQLEYRRQRANP